MLAHDACPCLFTDHTHPWPISMYVCAPLSSLLTCSSFDSPVCKFSLHIYQIKVSLYYKTKLVMALPAIADLNGDHLILGMLLYHF